METWKTLSRETVFEAAPYVRVEKETVEIAPGRIVPDFYQVRLGVFALVVPVLDDGRILTIRQYKHGVGRVTRTFPAGFQDRGEAPEAAAARELREETGYRAGRLIPLGRFVDHGNQIGATGHYFLGFDCARIAAPDSGDLEEMTEEVVTPDRLNNELWSGQIDLAHHAMAWSLARAWMADHDSAAIPSG